MQTLFVDFETAYSSKEGYTLRKMDMTTYIRDSRFKAFGLGYKLNEKRAWVRGDHIDAWAKGVDWAHTLLVAQNCKFDGAILAWRYGIVPAQYSDTLSIARAVLGTRIKSHSLVTLAEHFGLQPKGQLLTDGFWELTPEQATNLADYCLHDVELCSQIYDKLVSLFPNSQAQALDWTIRAFTEPVLRLDTVKLASIAQTERLRRTNIFNELGIPKEEFASNVKFPALLVKQGYEVPTKASPRTGKKIPALALGDVEFLELCDSDDERLGKLCEARIAAKSTLLETRSEKLYKVGLTGAFPFDVGFSGAQQTHRYSGGPGAGGNPQNFPKGPGLREAVVAPEGHKLIVADFSAIELRIQAWLSGEQKLISQLSTPTGDPYSDFATRLYGRQITKANKTERDFGKEVVLGCGYGMGAEKFSKRVKLKLKREMSQDEAKGVIALYRGYYSMIPRLWEELEGYIPLLAKKAIGSLKCAPFLKLAEGCVILPSGLRLQYPNLRLEGKEWVYDVYRQRRAVPDQAKLYGGKFLENICQALAGEIYKLAGDRVLNANLRMAGGVHDEILVAAHSGCEATEAKFVEQAMTRPPSWWPEIRLGAEIGIGANWYEAKH